MIEDDRKALVVATEQIGRTVAQWIDVLEDENLADRLAQVDGHCCAHLLDLLAGLGVFGRCSATAMLPALEGAGVHIGEMLTS